MAQSEAAQDVAVGFTDSHLRDCFAVLYPEYLREALPHRFAPPARALRRLLALRRKRLACNDA